MIQLHDKQFVPFISAKEIEFAIAKMVERVEDDFADEIPVFIGVLNGSFMVVSDFMKDYKKPCELSFIKMASYEGTSSTDEVKQLIGLNQDLSGRSVVIIEDIVDTGNTLVELKELFKQQKVKHFKIATLFLRSGHDPAAAQRLGQAVARLVEQPGIAQPLQAGSTTMLTP